MNPHEMRAKAAQLFAEAQKLYDAAKAAARELTVEENTRCDAVFTEAEGLLAKAKEAEAREKRLGDLGAQLRQDPGRQSDPPPTDGDLPHNDSKNKRHAYSVLKALRQALEAREGKGALDGIELEVHQELQKRNVKSGHEPRGVLIPWDLTVDMLAASRWVEKAGIRRLYDSEHRDLTTTTGAGAVYEVVSRTMIDLLRNLMLTRRLGVRMLNDMNGNFSIPKQTGTGTAYWVTEGNAVTESNPTIGAIDFTPKTIGAFTDYSRKFLKQTSVDAEMFVREDLATVIALEMDRVTFAGSGTGAEPSGIITLATGAQVIALGTDGGALTWAKLVALETGAATVNALTDNFAFVTNPAVRGSMRAITRVAASTFGDFLWGDGNLVVGYPAHATNQIPANLSKGAASGTLSAAIFGNWSDAIWAMWGGLDILVDPYAGATAGNVRIVELQDADFKVRRAESFSVMKDILP